MAQPASRPGPRIESFSDLIFGLALSIGAIALIGNPPKDVPGLYNDLLTFAFNFLILISVWMRYTRVVSALPMQNRRTVVLNTVLLFTVSLEPFLFNTVRSGYSSNPASVTLFQAASSLYGLDLGTMMLVMGVFTTFLSDEERRLVPGDMIKELRREAISWFAAAAFFLVSSLPTFDSVMLGGSLVRTDLWLAALVISLVRRGLGRLKPAGPVGSSSA